MSGNIILDDEAKTDDAIGTYPDQKTIEQRLESGFFLLDKGAGPTSHQVAAWVRDMLKLPRLGHGGTLDPFATGVLPLMSGKAMRLTKQILEHNKTYIAVFQFKNEVDQEALGEVMEQLTGRIYNVPPEISAVRVQVRTRKIHDFTLLDQSAKRIVARIRCDAGTYIRTMARDMGLLLDQPVELKELRREDSGRFGLNDCVQLHEIADAIWLWKECNEVKHFHACFIQPRNFSHAFHELSLKTVQLQHLHMVHLCFAQDLFQSQTIYHPAKMSSSRASKAKQYASSK